MDSSQQYERALDRHYRAIFGYQGTSYILNRGRPLPQACRVLEYPPSDKTFCWVYATCGMTVLTESALLELFLLSPYQTEMHVELLTMIAHYHQTGAKLGLGHTVNFGRPWLDKSSCSCGLLTLPYTFGPPLENADIGGQRVRVLWLLPITPEERAFKVAQSVDALEQLFEKQQFDYLDPMRPSVVAKEGPAP